MCFTVSTKCIQSSFLTFSFPWDSPNFLSNALLALGLFKQYYMYTESSIVPIPKGGDSSESGKYQPVSLLSIMSKLLDGLTLLLAAC